MNFLAAGSSGGNRPGLRETGGIDSQRFRCRGAPDAAIVFSAIQATTR